MNCVRAEIEILVVAPAGLDFSSLCMLINVVKKDVIRPVGVLLYSRIDTQHVYISRTNLAHCSVQQSLHTFSHGKF